MSTVVVIAKEPRPGHSKTRLNPPCSDEQAARIAAAALEGTLTTVTQCSGDRRLLYLAGEPGPWLPACFEVRPQRGTTLDERIASALSDLAGEPVLVIGMDTPQLLASQLDDALRAIERVDACLGMASDGGWWALGLRNATPAAVLGVPMSTAVTGSVQMDRLLGLGLGVELLPVMTDVDTFRDALRVAEASANSAFARCVSEVTAEIAEVVG